MQNAGDAALAAAVDANERYLVWKLEADWNKNGLYNHVLSDLTQVVKSLTINRDITGALPPETTGLEGFSAAQMEVTLGGKRPGDANSIAELLAPWRTDLALFGISVVNIPIRAFIGHRLADGTVVTPQQFQGKIMQCRVDSGTKEASLICLDPAESTRASVTLPQFALPPGAASDINLNLLLRANSQWVIDFILRQNGYYMTPPEHAKTFFSATMHGAVIPNRGHQSYFWIGEGTVTEGDAVYSAGRPGWGLAYGPTNAYWYGVFSCKGNFTTYTPVAGTALCIQVQVNTTNAAQQVPGQVGTLMTYAPGADFLMGNSFALSINSSRQIILTAYKDQVLVTTVTGPTLGTGWQDVWVEIELGTPLSNSTVRFPGLVVSGVNFSGLNSGTLVTYPCITIHTQMPMHDLQVSDRTGLATGTTRYDPATWVPQADIDTGLNDVTGIPIRRDQNSWELLKEVVEAEFGVIGFSETGRPYFKNRDTVRRGALTTVKTVDATKVITNLATSVRAESVRNSISSTYTPFLMSGPLTRTDVWDVLYEAKDPSDIQLPTGTIALDFVLDKPGVVEDAVMPTLYTTAQWNDAANELGTRHGFAVVRTDSGTEVTSGVSVISITPLSPQGIKRSDVVRIVFNNTINFPVQLKTTDNRPAFRIRGLGFHEGATKRQVLVRSGSIAKYGERTFEIPDSDWTQTPVSLQRLSLSLLDDLQDPVPVVEELTIVGDCRLQLSDVLQLEDRGGLGGPVLVIVSGISRTLMFDGEGVKLADGLTVRPLAAPGKWILGHTTWSVLGTTTQI